MQFLYIVVSFIISLTDTIHSVSEFEISRFVGEKLAFQNIVLNRFLITTNTFNNLLPKCVVPKFSKKLLRLFLVLSRSFGFSCYSLVARFSRLFSGLFRVLLTVFLYTFQNRVLLSHFVLYVF